MGAHEGLPGAIEKDDITPGRSEAAVRVHFIECSSMSTGQRRQAMGKQTPLRFLLERHEDWLPRTELPGPLRQGASLASAPFLAPAPRRGPAEEQPHLGSPPDPRAVGA